MYTHVTFWIKVSTVIPTEAQVNHISVILLATKLLLLLLLLLLRHSAGHASGLYGTFHVVHAHTHSTVRVENLQPSGNYTYCQCTCTCVCAVHVLPAHHFTIQHRTDCCCWLTLILSVHLYTSHRAMPTDALLLRLYVLSECLLRGTDWIFKYSYYLEWT